MAAATILRQQKWQSYTKLQSIKNMRNYSNNNLSATLTKRSEMFTEEQRRQRNAVGRVEKIEVRYQGLPEDVTLMMNRELSTPFNCAQHLSEGHCKRSALALIDGNVPWDMHRPLVETCTLQLLNFMETDPHIVNKAFWRTCSFMLGAALQNCFKEEAHLELHSFPGPNIKSGSFVHDVVLNTADWLPTKSELRAISAEMCKLAAQAHKIERLEVHSDLAMEMFKDSRFKHEQLPNIAHQNQGRVVIYRLGNHVDISRGPMVGSTSFLGKCTISAAHNLGKVDSAPSDTFYRIQGVALPAGFAMNHIAYGTLEERAKKLNPARLPNAIFEQSLSTQQMA